MRVSTICVFAGAGMGAHDDYRRAAVTLGSELAERQITLVYGGASIGLMGALADAVLADDGDVIGVIPRALVEREVSHVGLSELRVVDSMHERKALMAGLSDGFVSLPGGLGTFEELLEVATWTQLGVHAKPVGLLNVRGYFDALVGMLDHAVAEAFLAPEHREIMLVEVEHKTLLDRIDRWAANSGAPQYQGDL